MRSLTTAPAGDYCRERRAGVPSVSAGAAEAGRIYDAALESADREFAIAMLAYDRPYLEVLADAEREYSAAFAAAQSAYRVGMRS